MEIGYSFSAYILNSFSNLKKAPRKEMWNFFLIRGERGYSSLPCPKSKYTETKIQEGSESPGSNLLPWWMWTGWAWKEIRLERMVSYSPPPKVAHAGPQGLFFNFGCLFAGGRVGGEHSTVHEPLPHTFPHPLGGWEETTPSHGMTTGHGPPWQVCALSFLKKWSITNVSTSIEGDSQITWAVLSN